MDEREVAAHEAVFKEAMGIYVDRTKAYGDVWRNYGALSNLLSAVRKGDRLMETWWQAPSGLHVPTIHKDSLDDAFDMINYATFFIRNVREGNISGRRPMRPGDLFGGGPDAA